jgi:hypothetical protein
MLYGFRSSNTFPRLFSILVASLTSKTQLGTMGSIFQRQLMRDLVIERVEWRLGSRKLLRLSTWCTPWPNHLRLEAGPSEQIEVGVHSRDLKRVGHVLFRILEDHRQRSH